MDGENSYLIVVFEKFARAYLFQIAGEKSFGYLLQYTSENFCHAGFSILHDKWRKEATSTLLHGNLTCE